MSIIEAVILGVIQGLTEFLPVSSSGHLELAKALFGDSSVGKESMLMTVVLHFATALSTVVIFRKEIIQIFKGLFQFKNNTEFKFSLRIILSMIPAALVGILLKDEIESLFGGAVMLVGFMLLLTGILLFFADKAIKTEKEVGLKQSFLIGVSQAIAILPGISRSGATISTAVLLGIDREKAARFSFLMVVPLIMGAMLVDSKDYLDSRKFEDLNYSQRSEIIVNELLADDVIDWEERTAIFGTISWKEKKWEEMKKSESEDLSDFEKLYEQHMITAGLSSQQVEKISKHEYGQIRPTISIAFSVLGVGFICAFLTGIFACKWMISLVKKAQLKYFSYYCFLIGVSAIIISLI
jgi:undecaprenyl-diphosphatase